VSITLQDSSFLQPLGIDFEKILAQKGRNSVKKIGVDTVAMENAVAGHPAGIQLSREPRNTAPLLP
jgi:hypothetical protein